MPGSALVWDLLVRGNASPEFLKVAASADKAATAADRASTRMEAAGQRMTRIGSTITKSLTLPLLGLGAVAVDQAAKYSKALTLLETAGGEHAKNMTAISKGIESVAVKTGTSLDQLTTGMYTVAKAGVGNKWSVTKQLETLRAAAEGAKSEGVDLGTATNALTSVMMSYGKAAGTPIQVENEIIRASGAAKVSMQDFAGSLSTVVPIASKAGISFAQVGGAIATLTQHGTSAQEATQELAFTIRNLQAPNQVAQKAMQQLGLSVNGVEQNLGKKGASGGLIGTLSMVENAVTTHLGKAGLVVVDTFKKSASANADLNKMLGAMPVDLAKYSKGLLDGSVSIKSYQSSAKALGGTAGAGALQFLSLYKSSRGFNDLLKSGQPAQRTAAAALRDMLGGATGLNTALQLSGESSKYLVNASNSIANAAKNAGSDVLGWAKTQGLFTTKVDQAKEQLQVFAVEVGTALLPALTKIVGWVSKAFDWFGNLSSGTKKFIGVALGITAAIGPMLALYARFSRLNTALHAFNTAVRSVGRTSTESAGQTVAAATRQETAQADAAAAARVSAAQIIAAMDAETRAVILGTDRQIVALSSLRAYQRKAALAGVETAVVGGGVPLIAGGAGRAEGAAARPGVMSRLGRGMQGAGGLAVGLGLGIGGNMLGNAISGNSKAGTARNIAGTATSDAGTGAAIGSILGPEGIGIGAALGAGYGALKSWITGAKQLSAGEKDLNTVFKNSTAVVGSYAQNIVVGGRALKSNNDVTAKAALAQTDLAKRAASAGLTTTDLTSAITGNQAAYDRVVAAWKAGGNPSQASINALFELRYEFGKGAPAAQKYADAHGLVIKSEQLTANQTAVLSGRLGNLNTLHLSAATNATLFHNRLDDLTTSVKQNGTSLNGNSLFGQRNIAMVRAAASQALAHAQAVYQQTGSLKKADSALSSDRNQLIKQATQAGLSKGAVKKLADAIDSIPGNKHSKITVDTAAAKRSLSSFSAWYDSVIANLSQPHPTVPKPASSDPRNKGLGGLVGATKGRGGATGGRVPEGWFSVGEQGPELVHKAGGRVDVFSNSQSKHIASMLPMQMPGFANGSFPTGSGGIISTINRAHRMVEVEDLRKVVAAFKGTAADLTSAFATLVKAMKAAGASTKAIARAEADRSQVLALQAQQTKAAAQLSAMKDYRSGITSTLTGAFDPTTSGSITDFVNNVGAATSTNKAYSSELNSLYGRSKGNAALTSLINTLAGSGQTATLQTLYGASAGQLSQAGSAYGQYLGSVNAGGDAATRLKYGGATVASEQAKIDGLAGAVAQLAKAIGGQNFTLEVDGEHVSTKKSTTAQVTSALSRLEHEMSKGGW